MNPAIITETTAELGARGIMYDSTVGEDEWMRTAFPDMPYKDTQQPAQFQAYISDDSVNSLLGSFLEVSDIAGWIYGDDVPGTNDTITAKELDVAFKGMSLKYGDDSIVDLYLNCSGLFNFTSNSTEQDVSVLGTVSLSLWPRFNGTTEKAVELTLKDILFTGGIEVAGYNATAKIEKFLVDQVIVDVSEIGRLSAFKLKLEINTASKLLVPALNSYISKYVVPIPKNILGVFELSDLFLTYNNGYIYAGATPTFLPPTNPTGPLTHYGLAF